MEGRGGIEQLSIRLNLERPRIRKHLVFGYALACKSEGKPMILRHLADAIRGQNWFTILIELTVVVVGIFLGLQVDGWNERRKENSLERGYIERLEAEVDANIAVYQTAFQQAEETDKIYRDYFEFLHDPAVASPGESELLTVLCRVGIQARLRYDNTVYDELVSTGRLDIIRYIELTRSLKTYWTVQISRAQGISQLAPVNRQTFRDIEEFIFWQPALPGGGYDNCVFDFEKFETNNRAASLIAQAQRIQYVYLLAYQEILSKLTEVREALNRGYPEIVESDNPV
jgi:hypothetical protein